MLIDYTRAKVLFRFRYQDLNNKIYTIMQQPNTRANNQADTQNPGQAAHPHKPKIPVSLEGMIKGLDTRFRKIYERVKELTKKKAEINSTNDQTLKTIEEDLQNYEEAIQRLNQEISRVAVKNNDLITSYQSKNSKNPDLFEELRRRNKQISDLGEQMQTIMESLRSESTRTETLEKQILFMKKGNVEVENYFNKLAAAEAGQNDRNNSSFPKYKALLNRGGSQDQPRPSDSKGFEKTSVQAFSPHNELDRLLNISPKSSKSPRKGREIEALENRLQETAEVNGHFKQENEKLKKKIMSNIHSDYEVPMIAVQHTDRETVEHAEHAKKQQKLKISKLFADEDKLISHISHNTRDGVITQTEEEYIKKKDAQNEENFRRILEIKELERLREQIHQQDDYIKELERNVHEREHLLFDQKREITSLEDNLNNLRFDIQKNEVEKELLDQKYDEKKASINDMKIRYGEAVKTLPEDVRPRAQGSSYKENMKSGFERGGFSYAAESKPSLLEDEDLADLLKMTPKALEIRKV